MTLELLSAFAAFAFVSSITPGPNNLMLMSSGANYGLKKTIPHLLGVGIGFTLMIAIVGLGVMQLFNAFPVTYEVLKVISVIYLLYLAVKIAGSANNTDQQQASSKPITFFQAAIFQWVNPKAWIMAVTAISIYAPSTEIFAVLLISMLFGIINLPCISCWIVLGQKMQQLLTNPRRLKFFNYTMAALLVVSVLPTI